MYVRDHTVTNALFCGDDDDDDDDDDNDIISNNERDDNDVLGAVRAVFIRTNILARRFSLCSVRAYMWDCTPSRSVILSVWYEAY